MKKFVSLLCVLTLILLICSCGSDAQQTGLTTVRINEVAHSVFYAPQYVAMKEGFFEEEGISIELTNGGGADKVMTAVLTNQADIGLAGPEACIYVYNQGKEDYPKVFAQLTKRDGSFLVGRTNDKFSWNDLRGKIIIGGRAGGVPEMTLEYVMRLNGVEPHVDAVVDTSVQFNMMAGAFTGGNGDYVTLFEPTATEVEQAGQGYILTSIGQESGEIPYTAYFASQTYMKENSDLVQRFTNAIAKGQKWVQEHSPQEIAASIAHQFPDTDVNVLATVAQRYKEIDAWNTTPVMEQEALERLETVMEQAGELKRSDWVVFEELVDNSYANAVK
ncbi:MAG: ABC transporter substrate-binding protein [Ruminococcaceae bacterium]|nr:ABC transporter substrate-binding protein [Oscillospiraceae bacterium]